MLTAVALPFCGVVSHGYLLYIQLFVPDDKALQPRRRTRLSANLENDDER